MRAARRARNAPRRPTRRERAVTGLISIFWLALASGCAPGGGGSSQIAPDSVGAGEPVVIRLDLSVWGSGGDIAGRYSDIVLSYRLVGDDAYQSVQPRLIARESERESYQFVIPPFPPGTNGEIEYYIELKLDGVPSRIEGQKRIRIQ